MVGLFFFSILIVGFSPRRPLSVPSKALFFDIALQAIITYPPHMLRHSFSRIRWRSVDMRDLLSNQNISKGAIK